MTVLTKPKPSVPIRIADTGDEPELWRLFAIMHAEQETGHPIDWGRVVPFFRLATQHRRGIIGVIGERGNLEGAVFMVLEQIWYSNDWILLEYFNFVRPDCRRSTYSRDLINYARATARALKIELQMGVYSKVKTDLKVEMYRRIPGFKKMGENFAYRPDLVTEQRAQTAA